jgi:hypothetical protein
MYGQMVFRSALCACQSSTSTAHAPAFTGCANRMDMWGTVCPTQDGFDCWHGCLWPCKLRSCSLGRTCSEHNKQHVHARPPLRSLYAFTSSCQHLATQTQIAACKFACIFTYMCMQDFGRIQPLPEGPFEEESY